ncbi:type II secretion system protein [Thermoactinomyces sp. CICC 10523]|uniref:type II secretion system protein n=1 Tax=Thermoactinomyces sp. CICC 10523 TaxID=2767428 RepID=UPI0018DB8257|nr:prepilin-type N-terminal cleavage/methylation domain-containing protein [Thermoactinomyces sp. CICC 10523]MBH8597452.1 prepilin-type N-terminal cleavage/methylation domain-containing protein [Thermoactinomyces sp. CICC 10523]
MKRGEEGFTLAEVTMSLVLIGVFMVFAVPVLHEIKMKETEEIIRLEIDHWMENEMEKQLSAFPDRCAGESKTVKSEEFPKQVYLLQTKCRAVEPFLYQMEVEVQWKGKDGKTKSARWMTHRFQD